MGTMEDVFDQTNAFEMRGQLRTVEGIRRFIYAGNAKFTVVSRASGVRFTYRVRRKSPLDDFWFISVLTGPDNMADYQYLGYLYGNVVGGDGVYRHGGQRAKISTEAPSAKAWDWFFRQIQELGTKADQMEVWHEGTCGRCGRTLTVPASIENGFGPECLNYV